MGANTRTNWRDSAPWSRTFTNPLSYGIQPVLLSSPALEGFLAFSFGDKVCVTAGHSFNDTVTHHGLVVAHSNGRPAITYEAHRSRQ